MTFGFPPSYWDEYIKFLGYKVPILTSPTLCCLAVFLQPCDPCLISTSEKVPQAGYWGLWGIKAVATAVCMGAACFADSGRHETFMSSAATGSSSFVSAAAGLGVAATVKKSDHILNWVQMYEQQIIWHGLTLLTLLTPFSSSLPSITGHPNSSHTQYFNLTFPPLTIPFSSFRLLSPAKPTSQLQYSLNFYVGHSYLQP